MNASEAFIELQKIKRLRQEIDNIEISFLKSRGWSHRSGGVLRCSGWWQKELPGGGSALVSQDKALLMEEEHIVEGLNEDADRRSV